MTRSLHVKAQIGLTFAWLCACSLASLRVYRLSAEPSALVRLRLPFIFIDQIITITLS
jgi:hypothetical protein